MASIIQVGEKWRALVRRKGHPSYCKTFRVKAQAEAWARGIEADIDRDLAPKPAAVMGRALLVSDLIGAYRKLRNGSRPILPTSSEHYVINRLEKELGFLDAMRISPTDLVGYCEMRAEEQVLPYTINMEISKLGTVMRYGAMALKVQLPDVVAAARPLLSHSHLIGPGNARTRRPTQHELLTVLQALTERRGLIYADAVRFAVGTSMRRGEVVRARRRDVDPSKRMLMVKDRKHPRQKVGHDQWVPLFDDVWELLQRQPPSADPEDDRYFPIHPQTLSKYFKEACDACGVEDLHVHDMRHECTSALFELGFQIQEVALVTGHKSWAHLKRYTNLKPESVLQSKLAEKRRPPAPGGAAEETSGGE